MITSTVNNNNNKNNNNNNQGRIKALRGPRPIPNYSGGYIYTGVGKNWRFSTEIAVYR